MLRSCIAIISALYLVGCVPIQHPPLTPLAVQSLQTGIYNDVSKRDLFNASVTTLQDLGYIVDSADYDTGFVTAHNLTPFSDRRFGDTRITLFVTQTSDEDSRVRINIEKSTEIATFNRAQPTQIVYSAVLDPEIYQTLFNRIGQNILTNSVIN